MPRDNRQFGDIAKDILDIDDKMLQHQAIVRELCDLQRIGHERERKLEEALERVRQRAEGQQIVHELKTWPVQFAAIRAGIKKYDVRKNDRDFKVGDELYLREWNPDRQNADSIEIGYTGECEKRKISFMTLGGSFGLLSDICVLGFSR